MYIIKKLTAETVAGSGIVGGWARGRG